jgi:hypothetical protein
MKGGVRHRNPNLSHVADPPWLEEFTGSLPS